jgi:hypothetical protein
MYPTFKTIKAAKKYFRRCRTEKMFVLTGPRDLQMPKFVIQTWSGHFLCKCVKWDYTNDITKAEQFDSRDDALDYIEREDEKVIKIKEQS